MNTMLIGPRLSTFLLLFLPAFLLAQDSLHVTKVGQLVFPNPLADVQGYVAPNGAEYAIVTHRVGVAIVSLANPSQPYILHDIPGNAAINREAETFGHYAYITAEAGQGLRIIDLSGLPGSIAYKDTILDSISQSHTLYISDTVLYLFFSNPNPSTSRYSLADPWYPTRLTPYRDGFIHDGYVRNHIGYLCDPGSSELKIVDFNDPSQALLLGAVQTPLGGTHNAWLSDNGAVCYVAEEVQGASITAYNVTDPTNITELDRIRPSYALPTALPHNVKVKQDWLVTAHYTEGIHLVDAARPHNLIEVGYYDHSTIPPGTFAGSWGADPDLPSGLLLSSDMENGLIVLQPNYVRACYLEGRVTDAQTSLPILGATVSVLGGSLVERSDGGGNYAMGTVVPGSYSVRYQKPGYHDSLVTVQLANGVLSLVNMPLRPLAPIQLGIQVQEAGSMLAVPGAAFSFVRLPDSFATTAVADANGQLNTAQITQGRFLVYVGHWGHATVALGTVTFSGDTSFAVTLPIGYEDPFAVDLGWTTSATASSGAWVQELPIGTYTPTNLPCNPFSDIGDDLGARAYVTGNAGGGPFDDDVDQGTVVLVSPAMDLRRYDQPWLHLSTWFCSRTLNGALGGDSLWLEIDNGSTTQVLHLQTTHAAFWKRDSFQLANLLPLTADMRLVVRVKERLFDRIVEVGIDGFRISGTILADLPDSQTPHLEVSLAVAPQPLVAGSRVVYDLGKSGRPKDLRFEVHDMTGRLLHVQFLTAHTGEFQLDLALPSGLYLASLRAEGQILRSIRLLR
jgi:choice-of-anchor B domain-containing protein